MLDWTKMFPEGRILFYEGVNPDQFVAEMKEKFNFDPSKDDGWNSGCGWSFLCPVEALNEVYSDKYPMGS